MNRQQEINQQIKELEQLTKDNNNIIKKLIATNKNKKLCNNYNYNDSDILGVLISTYLKWNGAAIKKTAYSAFEDSNYHSFNRQFTKLWVSEGGNE